MTKVLEMTAASSNSAVAITVVGEAQRDGTVIKYITLGQNQPKANANQLYVWETTSENVPWGTATVGSTAIDSNRAVNSQKLDFQFRLGPDFIVGYAMAADPNTTCATIYIPSDAFKDPSKVKTRELMINVPNYGSGFVQVKYTGLPLYRPEANGNWVGIWSGDSVPYSGVDPLAKSNIRGAEPNGLATISVDLNLGSTYAVGYFMKALPSGRTTLAAVSKFDT